MNRFRRKPARFVALKHSIHAKASACLLVLKSRLEGWMTARGVPCGSVVAVARAGSAGEFRSAQKAQGECSDCAEADWVSVGSLGLS